MQPKMYSTIISKGDKMEILKIVNGKVVAKNNKDFTKMVKVPKFKISR